MSNHRLSRKVRRGGRQSRARAMHLCDFWQFPRQRACARTARVPIERRQAALPRPFPRPAAAGSLAAVWPLGSIERSERSPARAGRPGRGDLNVATMSSAEPTRRDFLYIATGAVGAVGAAASLVPLIAQMNPDASTIAAGAPIEVDLAPIAEGQVDQGVLARQADLHQSPHQEADRGGGERRRGEPARPAAGLGARQAGPRPVAGADRHLHPSRLHSDRASGRSTTATSAPATARSTTPPAASAAVRRRPTCRCRPTNSSPTPRSGSADAVEPSSCKVRS